MDPEPDDSTSDLVHHDEDPMGFESERFTPEEINAPQAILYVANEGQPRGSVKNAGSPLEGWNSRQLDNTLSFMKASNPSIHFDQRGLVPQKIVNKNFKRYF